MKPISLVVSDADGTLVNHDKGLSPATLAAAHKLREAGIGLAVVSSRPPRGMVMIAEALDLELFGGFNGGLIVDRAMNVVEQNLVPEAAARIAVAEFEKVGADIWVFADNQWLLTNPDGAYVPREFRTVQFEPTVVASFEPYLARVGKIVASSNDFDMLARAEQDLSETLGALASARRSQRYYLDVTHPTADKGHAARSFARHWGVPMEEVAVLGDMANDLPMFAVAGLAIAMGNATPEVQAEADVVTATNDDDGWAKAIEEIVLPRGR
ncbi:HAD family phosphatase [Bosea caraganae]|uniref:HAD family phosphatase n=1 Tax=Bosea caraganae TaxID=2763117 RepID=A0A370L1G8_9HYPH|nr:Cof-type HAD-IIB family hydrolase [Bosea caraganae]RDJ21301.1 HAD family phosphatase [Bosea caraganae]RDJ26441.1 HAD family phosphatase [Bosea caraganae]